MGKLPPYIECVWRSCASNPDIQWLIFTDDTSAQKLPENVRLEPATLDGLQKVFSRKLGFEVNLSHVRLLCHFKAAYGILFEEHLTSYSFWGHCDLDMIFGDLRKFFNEDILSAYDKLLCRGHLTLYRNTAENNRVFMRECPGVRGYRDVFKADQYHPFDEWLGVDLIYRYYGLRQFHEEIIADIQPPTRWRFTRFETVAGPNSPEQVFYWHNGKTYRAYLNCDDGISDDEFAYIHFQKRPFPGLDFDPFEANGFLVTPDGFYPYNREPLTKEDFARYNRSRWRPANQLARRVFLAIGKRLGLADWDA